MALDTARKRFSIVNVASPWRGILPPADGAIGNGDRFPFAFMYAAPITVYLLLTVALSTAVRNSCALAHVARNACALSHVARNACATDTEIAQ